MATALSVGLVQFVAVPDGSLDLRAGQVAFATMGVLLGTIWDSTARAGRETLVQADQLEEQALELPMWVFDRNSLAFLAVNEAAVKHYGYSRAEFLRMRLSVNCG